MQSIQACSSHTAHLALLLPVNCGVEHVFLQAFPLSTLVREPKTVAICGGNLAALRHISQVLEQHFQTTAYRSLVNFLIDVLPQTRGWPQYIHRVEREGRRGNLGIAYHFKNSNVNPKHIGQTTRNFRTQLGSASSCWLSCGLFPGLSLSVPVKPRAATSLTEIGNFKAQVPSSKIYFWLMAHGFLASFTVASVS